MATNDLFKQRLRIARFLALICAPMLIFISSAWKENHFIHEAMEVMGHLLVFFGVLTRIYSSLYAGGRKNTELMMEGTYSIVRNPLYVGSLLAVTGLGLQTGSFAITAFVIFVFMVLHKKAISKEEQFLSQKYGKKYQDYFDTVPRWIPEFQLWKQTSELVVKPHLVLFTMRDASVFVFMMMVIEILCGLRTSSVIPTWLILP